MIDLNLKSKTRNKKSEDETPAGLIILAVMPFVIAFWFGLECLLR